MTSTSKSRNRVTALLVALVLSLAVAAVGSVSWSVLIVANVATTPGIPWAVAVMAIVLWVYWKYFGGSGPPRSTAAARRGLLRARPVAGRSFGWSLVAGLSAVAGLAGLWILMVRLGMPGGNPTLSAVSGYPLITIALLVLMGSLVSPITEEAAFRGYAQVTLERVNSPAFAVGVSSLLFMFWHGPTQGFIVGKLVFFYIVGVVFGTIAYLNNSTLPALPVHIVGDLVFFTLIWPNDSTRALVANSGLDGAFWLTLAVTLLAAGFATWTFTRLRSTRREKH